MDKRATLEEYERQAELGGGEARRQRQHDAGKLTARERVERRDALAGAADDYMPQIQTLLNRHLEG